MAGSQLDFGPVDEYVRFTALQKLFFVRRYAGKLAYEIELHSGTALDSLPDRYAERLTAAVGVAYPRGDYLEDVDGGPTARATCAPGSSRPSSATT